MDEHAGVIAELTGRWSVAAQKYLDGDLRGYAEIASHSDDYSLFPPNGGEPRQGFDNSDEAAEWLSANFRGGEVQLDVMHVYASADLAVLVAIERQQGALGGLPHQDWSLRITLVFRREPDGWHLVHRHADPLTRPIQPDLFAAIARGDHAAQQNS